MQDSVWPVTNGVSTSLAATRPRAIPVWPSPSPASVRRRRKTSSIVMGRRIPTSSASQAILAQPIWVFSYWSARKASTTVRWRKPKRKVTSEPSRSWPIFSPISVVRSICCNASCRPKPVVTSSRNSERQASNRQP